MRPPGDFRRRRLTKRQQCAPRAALHRAIVERRPAGSRGEIRVALPFHERVGRRFELRICRWPGAALPSASPPYQRLLQPTSPPRTRRTLFAGVRLHVRSRLFLCGPYLVIPCSDVFFADQIFACALERLLFCSCDAVCLALRLGAVLNGSEFSYSRSQTRMLIILLPNAFG
jgi:hypothetical protein